MWIVDASDKNATPNFAADPGIQLGVLDLREFDFHLFNKNMIEKLAPGVGWTRLQAPGE